MPTIHGRLDGLEFPVIELLFVGGKSPLTAVLDTGFDGELLRDYDDLLGIGLEPRVDRVARGASLTAAKSRCSAHRASSTGSANDARCAPIWCPRFGRLVPGH